MRPALFITCFILFFISCRKPKDDCTEDPQRIVDEFSSASFKRFGAGFYFDDMVLTGQNEIVVAGLNKEDMRQPFLVLMNDDFIKGWEQTFMLGPSQLYRNVRLISTSEDDLLLLSNSPSDGGSSPALELIGYNRAGYIQWSSTIKEENVNFRPASIITITNKEYVILSSEFNLNNPKVEKLHLTRVASNGDKIWTKSIQTESLYLPTHLVNGSLSSSIYTVSEHFIHKDNAAEVHVHKLDYDANLDWKKALIVSGRLWPTSSQIIAIGNEELLISFSSRIVGEDIGHISLIKMKNDGEIQWEKKYESCGDNVVRQVLSTRDGNLVLLSNTSSFGAGGFDVMITKLDSSGNVLWEKVYGGMHSDQGRKILEKPNGNFLIIGNTNENTISEAAFEGFFMEINKDGIPL